MGMQMDAVPATPAQPVDEVDVDEEQVRAIVLSWVVRALSKDDDPERYRQLIADLKNVDFASEESQWQLSMRLRALSECVSSINETCHDVLLRHVLYMSFWNCNTEVSEALVELIVNLAASNGVLVPKCLEMLVRNFLAPSCCVMTYLDCYTEAALSRKKLSMEDLRALKHFHLGKKNDVMKFVHLAIQRIVQLVPAASLRLHKIVREKMPHRSLDKEWNVLYVENMLRLDTRGIIGSRVLLGIVDRLIEIDVEIEWEDILKDEDANGFIFHMDLEEERNPGGPGSEAHMEHSNVSKTRSRLAQMADKMDLLMDLTLQHLGEAAEQGRVEELYSTLMTSFRTTVLTTHKSKFTQFLLFFLCSVAPTTCGANFANFLCDTFLTASLPKVTRMSAAAYLASYLARANFLSLSTISSSVTRILNWCFKYTPTNAVVKLSDAGLHGVFYSACQAVMYVLCFRLKDLYEDAGQRPSLRSLKLQQLINHQLRPLEVCLPSVVNEFLRQATAFQLHGQDGAIGSSDAVEAPSSKAFGGDHRLDMFFPFDPYLLSTSDRFIRPHFIYWSPGLHKPDSIIDSDHIEEGEPEEEEPVVEDAASPFDVDAFREQDEEYEGMNLVDDDMMVSSYDDDETCRNSLQCMSITPPRMLPANLSYMLPIA